MPTRIQRINPDTLHGTPGYHHVAVVEPGRMAYLAGQCPVGLDGKVVEGDVLAQVDQVAVNIGHALAAAGAEPSDVVRSVIYVASSERQVLADVWTRLRASPVTDAFTTASTLLGIAQLGFPGQLVEVDLTVALPD
jgi:enamine deaminase RidA (YjgF/YER057c/UK114 family)